MTPAITLAAWAGLGLACVLLGGLRKKRGAGEGPGARGAGGGGGRLTPRALMTAVCPRCSGRGRTAFPCPGQSPKSLDPGAS